MTHLNLWKIERNSYVNLLTVKCRILKCMAYWTFTIIYTCVSITQIKIKNISISLENSLVPTQSPTPPWVEHRSDFDYHGLMFVLHLHAGGIIPHILFVTGCSCFCIMLLRFTHLVMCIILLWNSLPLCEHNTNMISKFYFLCSSPQTKYNNLN